MNSMSSINAPPSTTTASDGDSECAPLSAAADLLNSLCSCTHDERGKKVRYETRVGGGDVRLRVRGDDAP